MNKDTTKALDAVSDVDAAAKTLAACMDYPWEHMPEQGRAQMRKHAQAVIDASTQQAAKSAAASDLTEVAQVFPPLPIEWKTVPDADGSPVKVWRAFQMRDYALAAKSAAPAAVARIYKGKIDDSDCEGIELRALPGDDAWNWMSLPDGEHDVYVRPLAPMPATQAPAAVAWVVECKIGDKWVPQWPARFAESDALLDLQKFKTPFKRVTPLVAAMPAGAAVGEAIDDFLYAYRKKYSTEKSRLRANAPLYAEVAALNAALVASRAATTPTTGGEQ